MGSNNTLLLNGPHIDLWVKHEVWQKANFKILIVSWFILSTNNNNKTFPLPNTDDYTVKQGENGTIYQTLD